VSIYTKKVFAGKKSDRKNVEPTPRTGNTVHDNQMPKKMDQDLTTQWKRNVEWYEKTANRPSEWGELKKQCTQIMQTRRVGWVVRNKYLGDNHQNNNG
jgi:hypothetical protein